MKVLISSCLLGNNVRWNKQNKLNKKLLKWAESEGLELVAVCPEDELLGTPRSTIRLIQIEEKTCAMHKGTDIIYQLKLKCREILDRHPDAKGFIGIHGSPTCGIGVGVKNLGKVVKGIMHQESSVPTTQSNALKNQNNKDIFVKRMKGA